MADNQRIHRRRVDQFKKDLSTLSVHDVIRKYITTGTPVGLSESLYFELRREISNEFGIHPSSVIIVGSRRTGFSIVGYKRYREFRNGSDIDVSIISQTKFDFYWDEVFKYSQSDLTWLKSKGHYDFKKMLFDGWIDPTGLPAVNRFIEETRWQEFFDGLMQSRKYGNMRISARLYRNWERLEEYQKKMVLECQRDCQEELK